MEQKPPPQASTDNDNWFDRHKILTGFSIVILAVFSFLILHVTSANNTATLGARTVKTPTVSEQPLSPTLLPTDTPTATPTPSPTVAPTRTPIIYHAPTQAAIYIPPTTTSTPANPQTETQQTTQQQQCAGATALCSDGTCSYAAHHQGTCSHHGGVAQWYN